MPFNYSSIPFTSRREAERFAYGIGGQRAPGSPGAVGGVTAVGTPGGVPAAGTLTGAPAFGYAGAYGGIPQVPSPGVSQGAAIGANLGNAGQLFDLAGQTNTFNNAQALAALASNLPGYSGMAAQASQNIAGNLAGNVAPDVWRNLQQMAAERGTAIGSPGSPNSEAGLLRALGLTTLDLQNLGQQQLSGAVARTPVGPQFNPASMYLSPDDWQAAQMAANLYASAPIPAQKAQADLAALRSGLRAGTGSTTMSNSDKLLSMLPTSAPASPSRPSTPQTFSPRSQPAAPGRSYDPNAYASSREVAVGELVSSPYNLGGYNFDPSSVASGSEVAPELQKWAEGDFSDIFPTFGAGFLGL